MQILLLRTCRSWPCTPILTPIRHFRFATRFFDDYTWISYSLQRGRGKGMASSWMEPEILS